MSEEMLFSITQKSKQLIADAYMTFHGTRGARHGVQLWQKASLQCQEVMIKIHKKGVFTSFLDRFQNDEAFHAGQTQKIGRKRMVRFFGLHQNNRYYAQCFSRTVGTIRRVVSFSVRAETKWRKAQKRRPLP